MAIDGHIHVMPTDVFHMEHADCWCEPELIEDDNKKVYLHRELN